MYSQASGVLGAGCWRLLEENSTDKENTTLIFHDLEEIQGQPIPNCRERLRDQC